MSKVDNELCKLFKLNTLYVGKILAEENRKIQLKGIQNEINNLQSKRSDIEKPSDPFKTIEEVRALSWHSSQKKEMLKRLKNDPKVRAKKSIVNMFENLLDNLL